MAVVGKTSHALIECSDYEISSPLPSSCFPRNIVAGSLCPLRVPTTYHGGTLLTRIHE
jgi:hypothetical protein